VELLSFLVQTGFAGLFVWLLFDTRRENSERQKRADEREDKLSSLLAAQSQTLTNLVTQIGHIVSQTGSMQDTLIRVVSELQALSTQVKMQSIEILQLRNHLSGKPAPDTHELKERL
jgi:septal ring factor EnvC (AmiA/AmiB activator)